ncbi:glycosyl transferase, group 1 [Crocosphaera subtropica ATCC 51142]|uniref:Glycosyl transferase, group 1 n=1 Tax=Crocosphaera subtropica (strain ATCC 51142 / BH68) TaxID=43989 RepID=B1WVB5_CROS5|nr:glycosyltransferase [Crocosphaera subtropica]ACB53905.1 glycosyl transferase, group 1 [Crocosphaera subtropica ATCC 51142]
MNHKILWLRRRFDWMGKHSGYDQLCESMSTLLPHDTYKSVWQHPGQPQKKILRSMVERVGKKAKGSPMYALDSTTAEIKTILKSLQWHPDLIHVTYVENQLGILPNWKERLSCKIIGTSHQPAGWWRLVHKHPKKIANLDALIVLGSREVSYFEQYLPGRVFFIPHGVDTDFFCPPLEKEKRQVRCVFSGKHLRDLSTLAIVIDQVLSKNPEIQFDIIMPRNPGDRTNPTLIRIARHSQVHWYQGVSDNRLRKLYQQANMLVLPIIDCTANNALLESISCGLPVISNDVGGLLDYTRDTFAELLPIGDVDGFVNAILKLTQDSEEQQTRSQAARKFAEEELDWIKITKKTIEIYQKILTNN